ncbi:MAG: M1 family metallopeptidase [Bacteroidetes bacterium]|nr:M1 family metallopeptidase [Bacteroidota bacterium]
MKLILSLFFTLVLSGLASGQALFEQKDDGQTPDRNYDVQHYKISLVLNLEDRSADAVTEITWEALATGDTAFWFHAVELDFKKVTQKGKPVSFRTEKERILFSLKTPVKKGEILTTRFEYRIDHPRKGMYFRIPTENTPYRRTQVWTQGEDHDNRFWFPCYDYPSDKATSELIVTIPDTLKALSNGKLVKETQNKKDKTKTFHWKQQLPHSSYLIMLGVGNYTVVKDKAGTFPLEYWVYPDLKREGVRGFSKTPDMVKFYTDYIGIPLKWEKYAQIVIQDFMFGGMENTTATTMNDNSINLSDRDLLDGSSDALVAHELVHQWWGDRVTCRDFRHLWLNESFATYFETLYTERFKSKENFETEIYDNQYAGIFSDRSRGRRPLVHPDSYTTNLYPRGASILHMLRFVLGEEGFRDGLRHYLQKFDYQPASTEDFQVAIEEETGQNLHWFFDQWIYKAGFPQFAVSWDHDSSAGVLMVRLRQTQPLDSLTGIFKTPFLLEIDSDSSKQLQKLWTASADTVYKFTGIYKLKNVIFDKWNYLLETTACQKPESMWLYQLENAENFTEIYDALLGLGDTTYSETVFSALKKVYLNHPYENARSEALNFMAFDKERLSLELLKPGLTDSSSMVRATSTRKLSDLKQKDEAWKIAKSLFESDLSYTVQFISMAEMVKLKPLDALTFFKAKMDKPDFSPELKAQIIDYVGEEGVKSSDIVWLEGFTRPPFHRKMRESALRAMKRLDIKNERTINAWLAVIQFEDDEILVENILTEVSELPKDNFVPALMNLYSTTKFKTIKDQAKLELVQFGKFVN